MFRTTRIDLKRYRRFVRGNARLLLLLSLLLIGICVGCTVFLAYGRGESTFLGTVLAAEPPEIGVRSIVSALYNACFQSVLLLAILFFCGLSACGLPVIVAVPVFFGLGFGMSAAYYYSLGWRGVLLTVTVWVLPFVFKAAAVLMGSAEAMRMSVLLSGKLLSLTAGDGMRRDLRLYMLRFAVFSLVAILGGIAEVLLGIFCGGVYAAL